MQMFVQEMKTFWDLIELKFSSCGLIEILNLRPDEFYKWVCDKREDN